MFDLNFVFLIVLVFISVIIANSHQNLDMTISRYSTKTAYIFKPQTILKYDDFTPKKVWAMYR
jgi:hypothetical protein